MSADRSERLLNLAICLLMARRFVSKNEIHQTIEGYRDASGAAFERLFERDKDELRQMGVPISVGSNDPFFEEEVGYRIKREDFELPPISFDSAELAVLGLASSVWDEATQADQTKWALAKLRAAGVDPEPGRLAALAPNLGAKESAFEPIWQAVLEHIEISFKYHKKLRRLQPWVMTHRRGSWYVYGFDVNMQEPRTYRLSRVESKVNFVSPPAAYEPEQVDTAELLSRIEPVGEAASATLAIRVGYAPQLRRRGQKLEAAESQWDVPSGFEAYDVPYSADFAAEIAQYAPNAMVLAPVELREAVIAHLQGLVAALSQEVAA